MLPLSDYCDQVVVRRVSMINGLWPVRGEILNVECWGWGGILDIFSQSITEW